VGLSTHSSLEFDEALGSIGDLLQRRADRRHAHEAGRPGTGVNYAVTSQARSDRPVFVTGGVNADQRRELVSRGTASLRRGASPDRIERPEASAREIREALDDALSAVPVEPT
jgi:thiamine monophosphate synthase